MTQGYGKSFADLDQAETSVVESQAGEEDRRIRVSKLRLLRRNSLCFKGHGHRVPRRVQLILYVLALFETKKQYPMVQQAPNKQQGFASDSLVSELSSHALQQRHVQCLP